MPETEDRRRAGTRTATAIVYYFVDLPDPEAEGNRGGVGFDDESDQILRPSPGLARHWCQQKVAQISAKPGHRIDCAEVRVDRWDPVEWSDSEFGTIYDAEAVAESVQYGQVGDDGTVVWGGSRESVGLGAWGVPGCSRVRPTRALSGSSTHGLSGYTLWCQSG
jgi:hypothetical protein